ncbi:MAG: hypothetical protein LH606_03865 [Cytophagaceae bacterium]|nr:hypothetical protein [Cytophagaceae bacterium]
MEPKIESTDDLRAERARLQNQVQLAKAGFKSDLGLLKTNESATSPALKTAGLIGSFLFNNNKIPGNNFVANGVRTGVFGLLSSTVLRRLPLPLRFAAPYVIRGVANSAATSKAVDKGRDVLINFLTWVKKKTADPPTKKY